MLSKVQVTNNFGAIRAGMRPRANMVIRAALANIAQRAASSMEGKTPPSAAGTPPAIRTGFLHGSIDTRMVNELVGIVYTNVDYAPHLEYGTIFMAPRPWLRPATEAERAPFMTAMAGIFRA